VGLHGWTRPSRLKKILLWAGPLPFAIASTPSESEISGALWAARRCGGRGCSLRRTSPAPYAGRRTPSKPPNCTPMPRTITRPLPTVTTTPCTTPSSPPPLAHPSSPPSSAASSRRPPPRTPSSPLPSRTSLRFPPSPSSAPHSLPLRPRLGRSPSPRSSAASSPTVSSRKPPASLPTSLRAQKSR
jgi:hypothetical protein